MWLVQELYNNMIREIGKNLNLTRNNDSVLSNVVQLLIDELFVQVCDILHDGPSAGSSIFHAAITHIIVLGRA
jgi:hypothetical protein